MTKFEYCCLVQAYKSHSASKFFLHMKDGGKKELEAKQVSVHLNELGQHDWELVSVVNSIANDGIMYVFYFKRPLT